jgi:hypothetical protein
MLLGEALWEERFDRAADVIGRVVRIDGQPHTIIGVLPRGLAFPSADARLWRPNTIARVSNDPDQAQRTSGMTAMARLAPGVTAAQAEAEGTAMARSVAVTMATTALFGVGGPPVVHVRPLAADMTGTIRPWRPTSMSSIDCASCGGVSTEISMSTSISSSPRSGSKRGSESATTAARWAMVSTSGASHSSRPRQPRSAPLRCTDTNAPQSKFGAPPPSGTGGANPRTRASSAARATRSSAICSSLVIMCVAIVDARSDITGHHITAAM